MPVLEGHKSIYLKVLSGFFQRDRKDCPGERPMHAAGTNNYIPITDGIHVNYIHITRKKHDIYIPFTCTLHVIYILKHKNFLTIT